MLTPRRRCKSGSCTTSCTGALAKVACSRPTNPTRSTGAAMRKPVYSARRRAKLRGCSTCQRKLKLSSTFLMVPMSVQASSARPREPTTPLLTRPANCSTRVVSSCAAAVPSGRKNSSTIGSRSRRAPKIFSTAKLKASSGMSDSSVV